MPGVPARRGAGRGGGRHTASIKVGEKKSAEMLTHCWKPGVCWHTVWNSWGPETPWGEFAHTNSFYLWTSTECSGERVGEGQKMGANAPSPSLPPQPSRGLAAAVGKGPNLKSSPDTCLKGAKAVNY